MTDRLATALGPAIVGAARTLALARGLPGSAWLGVVTELGIVDDLIQRTAGMLLVGEGEYPICDPEDWPALTRDWTSLAHEMAELLVHAYGTGRRWSRVRVGSMLCELLDVPRTWEREHGRRLAA